jgi:Flp pilus assembly pilin Flp
MEPTATTAIAKVRRLAGTFRLTRDEDGQDLLEYGLLAALIALVALSAVTEVGQTINNVFWRTIADGFGF